MAIVYSVMAVGNVIISIPLAMWMGPVGSALGTAISLVLVNGLAMNIYYRKKDWVGYSVFLEEHSFPDERRDSAGHFGCGHHEDGYV